MGVRFRWMRWWRDRCLPGSVKRGVWSVLRGSVRSVTLDTSWCRRMSKLRKMKVDKEGMVIKEITMEEITMEEINMEEITMEEITMEEINMEEINMEEINMEEINMEEINMEEIITEEINMEEINMKKTRSGEIIGMNMGKMIILSDEDD